MPLPHRPLLYGILQDAWHAAFVAWCGLWLLEGLVPGFVSRFMNIHLLTGLLAVLSLARLACRPSAPAAPRNLPVQGFALLAAGAAWLFLPDDLKTVWRALAVAAVLTSVLVGLPILIKSGHTAAE